MPNSFVVFLNKKAVYGVILVAIIAVSLSVFYLNSISGSNLDRFIGQPVNQTQLTALQNIAGNATLANRVGPGIVYPYPSKISGKNVTLVGGKPTVIYVGAEYCPYCALTRWGFIIALMRFGSFQYLRYMASSSSDVFPSTPTFTFYNSTYGSSAISFLPTEIENRSGAQLQQLSQLQSAAALAYDTNEAIPFIDFGNQSVQIGIPQSTSPGTLRGMNWSQIIVQLSQPNSTVAQTIVGQANIFTAQICRMDNFTPASVCDQPYVKSILGS